MNTITHEQLRDKLRDLARFQLAAADFLANSPALSDDYDNSDHPHQLRETAKENLKLAGEGFHMITGNAPLPLPLWCVPRIVWKGESIATPGPALFVVAHDADEALATAREYLNKVGDTSRLGSPGLFATTTAGVIHDQAV